MRILITTITAALAILAGAAVTFTGHTASERDRAVILDSYECVVRCDTDRPVVHLLFSADSAFEGGAYALDILRDKNATASFFFTGNFLERPENKDIVHRAIVEGHYVGMHSNRHLQLAEWDRARTTRISVDSMLTDLDSNLITLHRYNPILEPVYILPPYEWCNARHARAYRRAGYTPINITPGIETYRDYTTPDMPEYRDSEFMFNQLWEYEKEHNLNGALIIIHLGTEDTRPDKFYHRLPQILDTLHRHGYTVTRL